jgi:hypothetical protein
MRSVLCFSEGVKSVIVGLQAEAIKLVPETLLITASYKSPDGTPHIQYNEYKLRVHTAGPNPDMRSIDFQDSTKKLTIRINASYECLSGSQGGIVNGGISFHGKVERECDLIWLQRIPIDFRVLGLSANSILVTQEEARQISESLSDEEARFRDLANEYDQRWIADLKRGPPSAIDY